MRLHLERPGHVLSVRIGQVGKIQLAYGKTHTCHYDDFIFDIL